MANNSLPAGTIISYAGVGQPTGSWLSCDGAIVKGDMYADLYAAIGTTWGNGDGTAKSFHLPDFRGMFLRGWAEDSQNDPDTNSRGAQHAGGKTGNNVGSIQTDAMQGHHHSFSWTNGTPAYGGPNNVDGGDERNGFYQTALNILGPSTDGTNGAPRVSAETRPKNVYVRYFISF